MESTVFLSSIFAIILKTLFFFFFLRLHCVACGLLVPQPGIEPVSPALGAWSANHWTTREVPLRTLFDMV